MKRDSAKIRAWLEYVVETAIDMLDELDGDPDLEDETVEADYDFEEAA